MKNRMSSKTVIFRIVLAVACIAFIQSNLLAIPRLNSARTLAPREANASQSTTPPETLANSSNKLGNLENRDKPPYPAKPTAPAKPATNGCLSAAEAVKSPGKDLCVAVHVFGIVELPDGNRFLDVCPPAASDDDCRFTILNPKEDRAEVGDLRRLQDQDVKIRGMVHSVHGRMGLVLSHVRQFSLGSEKFRPNPRLLHNFDSQSDHLPIRDPNLRASRHQRSFMNTRDTEPTPAAKKQ